MGDIRIGGLASGTDVQGIIDALIEARTKPIEILGEEKLEYEEDLAAWSDISTYMNDLTDSLDDLRTWETWNTMRAVSSNESYLTATATSAAVTGSYAIITDRLAQAHSVGSNRVTMLEPPVGGNASATSTTDLVAQGVLNAGDEFVVEGATITIDATESISSLRDKINASSASSTISASILDNRLVITRINTGTTEVSMADTTGSPLQNLGILDAIGNYNNELVSAQDAQFQVNGVTVNRDSNKNITDVIEGVSLNLHAPTGGSTITLDIENNTDTAKDLIKDFIEKYNTASSVLSQYSNISLVGESPDGAELNSVGILAKDSLVTSLLTNMRKYVTDSKFPDLNQINASFTYGGNTGIMNNLSTIGIWTSSKENQIKIQDEEKLDYMLENYFDEVTQLFRGVYDAETGYKSGVATDFYQWSDNVTQGITGEIDRRMSRLKDQISEADNTIEQKIQELENYETRLWQQFEAMENTIATLQSELSWLTSQLGVDMKK